MGEMHMSEVPGGEVRGLAIFDLDDTLLDGDATGLWTEWLIQLGWITDPERYRAIWTQQMADYAAGRLDMEAHLSHLLSPLAGRSVSEVEAEVGTFLDTELLPRLYREGRERIAWHRDQGHQVVIISASTAQLVAPLAERLALDAALATRLEVKDGCYTGRAQGIRTFRDGKLAALTHWLAEHLGPDGHSLPTWGYSDSRNDLALLEFVDHPHAVCADPTLEAIATQRHWPRLRWQGYD